MSHRSPIFEPNESEFHLFERRPVRVFLVTQEFSQLLDRCFHCVTLLFELVESRQSRS
jgi:hypothetical protein